MWKPKNKTQTNHRNGEYNGGHQSVRWRKEGEAAYKLFERLQTLSYKMNKAWGSNM